MIINSNGWSRHQVVACRLNFTPFRLSYYEKYLLLLKSHKKERKNVKVGVKCLFKKGCYIRRELKEGRWSVAWKRLHTSRSRANFLKWIIFASFPCCWRGLNVKRFCKWHKVQTFWSPPFAKIALTFQSLSRIIFSNRRVFKTKPSFTKCVYFQENMKGLIWSTPALYFYWLFRKMVWISVAF